MIILYVQKTNSNELKKEKSVSLKKLKKKKRGNAWCGTCTGLELVTEAACIKTSIFRTDELLFLCKRHKKARTRNATRT
jgi:hypothetical protein